MYVEQVLNKYSFYCLLVVQEVYIDAFYSLCREQYQGLIMIKNFSIPFGKEIRGKKREWMADE